MKVKVKARQFTGGVVEESMECNTVDDITSITKALVTAREAYVNDLRFVRNGLVEMYVYNHKDAVLEHLKGNTKELYELRNPNTPA